jgi:hypothetical protein
MSILNTPNAPQSSVIPGDYNMSNSGRRTECTQRNELLETVEQCNPLAVYKFGGILNAKGFTALHLLLYLCGMNPVELIWNSAEVMKMTTMGENDEGSVTDREDEAHEETANRSTDATSTEPSVYRIRIQITAH